MIMKTFSFIISFWVLLLMMGACSSGSVMRNATGFAYEIVVTMDKTEWDAPAGKAIKSELVSHIPGLPQAEPAFKVTYVTPDQFNGLLTYDREPKCDVNKIKEINDKINKQVPVVNINEDVVEVKVEEKTTVESDDEYDEFTFVPKRITPYNFDSSLVQAIMIDDLDTPDINMSLRYHDYLKRNKNFNCAHDFFSFFEVKNITGNKIDIIKDKLKNIQLYENLISNYETRINSGKVLSNFNK